MPLPTHDAGFVALPDLDPPMLDLAMPAPDLGLDLAVTPPPPDLASNADLARDPAGPWPQAALTIYGSGAGLGAILDSGPDEAQNIWAAADDALYLLRPGASRFVRYTASDGLHIQPFSDPEGHPAQTSITALAAGGVGQVFVGYYGYESDTRDTDSDALASLGWADRVNVGSDGKLSVLHYFLHCDLSPGIAEDRSVRRMIYAHDGTAAGHLFMGMDHGVVHMFGDQGGDHTHPEVVYGAPPNADGGGAGQLKIGENYGLAVLPSGDLWIAGGYGVGLQTWNATPHIQWVQEPFKEAFTLYSGNHALDVPYGYREDSRGVAVTADNTVWFASLTHGLASWDMTTPYNYSSLRTDWAVPSGLLDIAADPDGTIWLVTVGQQLLRLDPKTNQAIVWPGVSNARRIVMDTTVVPRALYVSTSMGLAVIRAK
jgi:hypothetical protein